MAKRGPAPKPTKMKLIQGTYRPDRSVKNELSPPADVPKCPTFIKGEARREWKRIVPELAALGILSRIDRAALAAYCTAWETVVESHQDIEEQGRTILNDKGRMVQNPNVAIRARAMDMLRMYMSEFGMTPASRARISVPERTDRSNPFNFLQEMEDQGRKN